MASSRQGAHLGGCRDFCRGESLCIAQRPDRCDGGEGRRTSHKGADSGDRDKPCEIAVLPVRSRVQAPKSGGRTPREGVRSISRPLPAFVGPPRSFPLTAFCCLPDPSPRFGHWHRPAPDPLCLAPEGLTAFARADLAFARPTIEHAQSDEPVTEDNNAATRTRMLDCLAEVVFELAAVVDDGDALERSTSPRCATYPLFPSARGI